MIVPIHKIFILDNIIDYRVGYEHIPMIDIYPELGSYIENHRNKFTKWHENKKDRYCHSLVSKISRTFSI